MRIKKFNEFINEETTEKCYEVGYCVEIGQHGSSFHTKYFDKAVEEAEQLKRKSKKDDVLGTEVIMIDVSPCFGNPEFAIIYMTEKYLANLDERYFNTTKNMRIWKKAAEECLKTNKTVIGKYNIK